MEDVYILNEKLEKIGVIDYYTSLIWASRYNEIGDCELYVQATKKTWELLKKEYYLLRLTSDMICRIEKIELSTDVENGDYFIVTGYDVKKILYQRIVWNTVAAHDTAERYIRRLIIENIIAPALQERKIEHFVLSAEKGFTESITEQCSYDVLGEKIESICKTYEYGYKVLLKEENDNRYFAFELYKGVNRSYGGESIQPVIFSPEYENISASNYIQDSTLQGNVALVAGEGEGIQRKKGVFGSGEGLKRYEVFVDAREISSEISYETLLQNYGTGTIVTENDVVYFAAENIFIWIITQQQLLQLQQQYPQGIVIEENGMTYYHLQNEKIAVLDNAEQPQNAYLLEFVYLPFLLIKGAEALAEYGTVLSFEGNVDTTMTFLYQKDYFLGDIVTIENEYGIRADARIVEVIETFDQNGYTVMPKFCYLEVI